MSEWSNLAKTNPFHPKEEDKAVVETLASSENITIADESAYIDNYTIVTSDGRSIPVLVDNGTRSVYPIRSPK